jgi:hypothetical protein
MYLRVKQFNSPPVEASGGRSPTGWWSLFNRHCGLDPQSHPYWHLLQCGAPREPRPTIVAASLFPSGLNKSLYLTNYRYYIIQYIIPKEKSKFIIFDNSTILTDE